MRHLLGPLATSTGAARSDSVLEAESNLERDLVVSDVALLDVAADLGDLEPVKPPEALRRFVDGALDAWVTPSGDEPVISMDLYT